MRVPDERDRPATEVAHVGVERLAAGDDEEDAAEGEERLPRLGLEEVDDVDRVDGLEHARVLEDLVQAEHAEDGEPHDHDRPEDLADGLGAAALHDEQRRRGSRRRAGSRRSSNADDATSKPSTALSTEMAGVMSPSP